MEPTPDTNRGTARKRFLILLLVVISLVFVVMIRQFVMTILLAAIVSGMAFPLYRRLLRVFRDRKALSSVTTLVLVFLVGGWFEIADDLMDPAVAAEYRRCILDPGGSKDAADLVADFLGRPFTFDAFEAWLAA